MAKGDPIAEYLEACRKGERCCVTSREREQFASLPTGKEARSGLCADDGGDAP